MGEAEDVDADHMTWTWNPAQPIFRLQAWLGKNQKELDLKLCCNDLLIHLDWTLDIITWYSESELLTMMLSKCVISLTEIVGTCWSYRFAWDMFLTWACLAIVSFDAGLIWD